MQKEFLKSYEGFLMPALTLTLTEHGHPSLVRKIAKMAIFDPCMEFEFFGPNDFIWGAMKVPFSDFIQNVSQALSMCISMWIKVNEWNYLKNLSQELKKYFCFRFLWISRKLESAYSFMLKYSKITVWKDKKWILIRNGWLWITEPKCQLLAWGLGIMDLGKKLTQLWGKSH